MTIHNKIVLPVERVRAIVLDEANRHGVTPEDVLSHSRKPKHVWARKWAMWRCRYILEYTTTQIGRRFGRDHSTVIYNIQWIDQLVELHPEMVGDRLLMPTNTPLGDFYVPDPERHPVAEDCAGGLPCSPEVSV